MNGPDQTPRSSKSVALWVSMVPANFSKSVWVAYLPAPDSHIQLKPRTGTAAFNDAANVDHMFYVPDAGHTTLINLFTADLNETSNALTTKEEGITIATGAWLGRRRNVVRTNRT
ncbi:hypothetical protein [Algirhabdus cladophorae]|uniref:hypothetical protein n=1 Tax=Algirhabdus cladophorae TaxID=3377108 RepID=UPI003B848F11